MPGGPITRTEKKEERKRTATTKQNTSNSSHLVQDVTPQILSLGNKPLVFLPMRYFRTFTRKFSNIDFLLRILPLKDDELVISEI